MKKKHFKYIFIVLLTFCVSFLCCLNVKAENIYTKCYCYSLVDGGITSTYCNDENKSCTAACGNNTWFGNNTIEDLKTGFPKETITKDMLNECELVCSTSWTQRECENRNHTWDLNHGCCNIKVIEREPACYWCSINLSNSEGKLYWSSDGTRPTEASGENCYIKEIERVKCTGSSSLSDAGEGEAETVNKDEPSKNRIKWAYVPAVLGNSFGFKSETVLSCEEALGDSLDTVVLAFSIIRYGAVVLLVVLTAIDFMKAVANSDDSALKKATNTFTKRAVITVIIFILPAIINLVVSITAISSGTCGIG